MTHLPSLLFHATLTRDVMGPVLTLEGQASVYTRPCVTVTSSSPHIQ